MTLQCPRCTSRAVQPSSHKTRLERILAHFFRHPFRCRHCGHRFFEFATRGQRRSMVHRHLITKAEQAFAGLPSEF